jgi:hypothetical protein
VFTNFTLYTEDLWRFKRWRRKETRYQKQSGIFLYSTKFLPVGEIKEKLLQQLKADVFTLMVRERLKRSLPWHALLYTISWAKHEGRGHGKSRLPPDVTE